MKRLIYFSFFIFGFSFSQAQIISTYAGNGTQGYSGDGGQAIDAELYYPAGVIISKSGDMYVSEANRVEMITMSTGIISRFAGNGSYLGFANGVPDTDAWFNSPRFLGIDDSGNVYIPDGGENIVYKVTVSTGIITIVAGLGGSLNKGYSGDGGLAIAAILDNPYATAVDDTGNIYIADYSNNVIRKVTVSTGIITTVVGNGYGYWNGAGTWTGAYYGDGGPATAAELYGPADLILDTAGNIYIADSRNNAFRKVTASTGIISTVAGNGIMGYSGNGGQAINAELLFPEGISLDSIGNLYLCDANSVVRKVTVSTGIISTIAGNGVAGYGGNGGLATNAELNNPGTVNFDRQGNLFIADGGNNVIRKIMDTNTVTRATQLTINNGKCTIFPNPSNGVFNLYLSNISNKCSLEVFNYLGENIYAAKINSINTKINLGEEPNGVYFYRVISESGELIGEGKFVIEK